MCGVAKELGGSYGAREPCRELTQPCSSVCGVPMWYSQDHSIPSISVLILC